MPHRLWSLQDELSTRSSHTPRNRNCIHIHYSKSSNKWKNNTQQRCNNLVVNNTCTMEHTFSKFRHCNRRCMRCMLFLLLSNYTCRMKMVLLRYRNLWMMGKYRNFLKMNHYFCFYHHLFLHFLSVTLMCAYKDH